MPKNNLISIITVVYNGEAHIENALKSVSDQTDKNFEYIIIDGNSSDNTLSLIKKYNNIVDILVSENDSGLYDAMNKGIKLASGKFIYFLNSDDFLFDYKVIEDLNFILKDIDSQIVFGIIDVKYKNPDYVLEKNIEFDDYNLKRGIQPMHSASFFKREILLKMGLFDLKYKSAADFELFCKASKLKLNYKYINRKIAFFNDGGYSSISNIGRIEGAKIIYKYYGRYWFLRFYLPETIKIPFKLIAKKIGIYSFILKFYNQKYNK